MKKRYIILFLTILFYGDCFSQIVYEDTTTRVESLFLGSSNGSTVKVLENKKIKWKDRADLEQTDQLSYEEFLNKIFQNDLFFETDMDLPFWRAELRKYTLQFFDPETGKREEYPVMITVAESGIYNPSFLMFQSKDKSIYGLIRNLHKRCALCICEEDSEFEIFINYKGRVYEGCAVITAILLP